jgi:hypothetical protein
MSRWYDDKKRLAKLLEELRTVHPKYSYDIVSGVLAILRQTDPDILNRFEIPSDIERFNKRWYDEDPLYWLSLNSLKNADRAVLDKIEDFLESKFSSIRTAHPVAARARRSTDKNRSTKKKLKKTVRRVNK